jgi:hypothetical protein
MINQITKVRLADGREVALTDWSSRPLYSTIDLLSGFTDQELRAFNYTESETVSQSGNFPAASGRTATLRDTNLSSASEMDSTEEFLVYAIKVEWHEFNHNSGGSGGFQNFEVDEAGNPIPSGPTMALLQNLLILELEVSEKAFPQAGLGWFTQGFGPVIEATAAAAARTYANNGAPSHDSADVMPIPVHLGGTEDFVVILHNTSDFGAVTFRNDAAGTDADLIEQLRIYLCGLHKRPTA